MAITLKRPTVAVELCTDLDLNAEHESLSAKLADRNKRGVHDDRITGDPETARIVELERLMQDSVLVFTLRALPGKKWAELVAAHPPREDDAVDENFGVNISTFVDAAMVESVESVINKTTGETVKWAGADWAGLADEMSDGQWQAFGLRVMEVNRTRGAVPFNRAASRRMESSDAK